MPEITLDGSPNDIGWVRATMLFPNNDAERRQYFGVELARFKVLECKDTDRLEIDASDLRLLIEAPAYDALKEITAANTKRAIVAGDPARVKVVVASVMQPTVEYCDQPNAT